MHLRETNPCLSASTVLIGAVINYFRRGLRYLLETLISLYRREPVIDRSAYGERRLGILFFFFLRRLFTPNTDNF